MKVRRYYRAFKAARTWVSFTKHLVKLFEETPIEERGPIVEELRKVEGMLGNVVLHILGVYSLDDDWD